MKFKAKVVDILKELEPIIAVSQCGAKKDYPDAYKILLEIKNKVFSAKANNGNVAGINTISSPDFTLETDGSIVVDAKDLNNTLLSFDKTDTLDIELKGTELTITPESDADKVQTVPAEVRQIDIPEIAKKFSKEVIVSKEIISSGINSVQCCIGNEKLHPQFHYWVMRFKPNSFRAVAGDGGHFAVYEMEGNIGDIKAPLDILIFKDHNPALSKVFSLSSADTVSLQEYKRDSDTDLLVNQIVVTVGSVTLILLGHDVGVKWPDENKILARSNYYKFVTSLSDWDKEIAGVNATFNDDARNANEVHWTKMSFDSKKAVVTLKAEKTMRSNRKVKILDHWGGDNASDSLDFLASTTILSNTIKSHGKGNIQIEMRDGVQPMVVRFYSGDKVGDAPFSKVDATGNKEQFTMFFGSVAKKNV